MSAPKILLVVNDKTRRPAFAGTFKSLGCQVLTTISAEDALAALEGYHPDVVLADMDIPDMKTNQFLLKIKENPKCKDIPLIFYTRFLNYKIANPNSLTLNQSDVKSEDFNQVLEILKGSINLVPGEIVLWVAEALTKQNIEIPPLMSLAAAILKNYKA